MTELTVAPRPHPSGAHVSNGSRAVGPVRARREQRYSVRRGDAGEVGGGRAGPAGLPEDSLRGRNRPSRGVWGPRHPFFREPCGAGWPRSRAERRRRGPRHPGPGAWPRGAWPRAGAWHRPGVPAGARGAAHAPCTPWPGRSPRGRGEHRARPEGGFFFFFFFLFGQTAT